jgi:hypothetical protein
MAEDQAAGAPNAIGDSGAGNPNPNPNLIGDNGAGKDRRESTDPNHNPNFNSKGGADSGENEANCNATQYPTNDPTTLPDIVVVGRFHFRTQLCARGEGGTPFECRFADAAVAVYSMVYSATTTAGWLARSAATGFQTLAYLWTRGGGCMEECARGCVRAGICDGTVRVFRQKFTLEDVIARLKPAHACDHWHSSRVCSSSYRFTL